MPEADNHPVINSLELVGHSTIKLIEEAGYCFTLLFESLFWILVGPFIKRPVRISSIFSQMMTMGVAACPIVFVLSFSIGVMLAIQMIYNLRTFGAESQVVVGVAFSVTREFGPLITGILIAGRTGSSLAAKIGTMQVNQEIDALRVMGINPVRYLVAPTLFAMIVMLPVLTFFSDLAGLLGGAIYTNIEIGLSFDAYLDRTLTALAVADVMQGIFKSIIFALIITLVGVSNGFSVTGGAEGVGKATTRSVVLSISYIVIADMIFTYFLNL
ncbi:MAG: ABC transporter [Legionellales bacterium]|nr:ABC transporter [Legionellales bacterium]